MTSTLRPNVCFLLAALLLALTAGVRAASAQTWTPAGGVPEAEPDGASISFETVGDRPTNSQFLTFDSTGVLYAVGSGIWRLPPGGTAWEELDDTGLADALLALRPDTVLWTGASSVMRSLDGGQTWEEVFSEGGGGFYETPEGTLLTGMVFEEPGIARSVDRGATWQPTPFVGVEPNNYSANAFLTLPDDHAVAPGRLVAGVYAGLVYSDDGAATWHLSDVWQNFRFIGETFALTPGGTALATVLDGAFSGVQLYGSADGASWGHLGTFHDPPDTALVGYTQLVAGQYGWSLPDGSVLVVTGRGFVWRSFDGGASWGLLDGRVPLSDDGKTFVSGTLVGLDGRLYVTVQRIGPEAAWVYRSTEAVLVASEPGPDPPEESSVRLEVRPNPSSCTATAAVTLVHPAEVTLSVYDALGRRVALVHRGSLGAGEHALTLDTSALPSGVYVVRLAAPSGEGPSAVAVRRFTVAH